jgi:hypothetical protein
MTFNEICRTLRVLAFKPLSDEMKWSLIRNIEAALKDSKGTNISVQENTEYSLEQ